MNRVREVRELKGFNQRELSELCHTPQSLVSAIEREVIKPWTSVAKRLSKVLKKPISELFPDDPELLRKK
jgi:transcriptional regulator with XRE-family HTH domain